MCLPVVWDGLGIQTNKDGMITGTGNAMSRVLKIDKCVSIVSIRVTDKMIGRLKYWGVDLGFQICAKTCTTDRGPPTLAMSTAGSE